MSQTWEYVVATVAGAVYSRHKSETAADRSAAAVHHAAERQRARTGTLPPNSNVLVYRVLPGASP